MEENIRYIIIGPGEDNSILERPFYEAISGRIENAEFHDPYHFPSIIFKKLYKARYNLHYRDFLSFIPNSIWNRFSTLKELDINFDDRTYLFFVIGRDVERLYNKKLLREVKGKYGNAVKTVLLLFDSIDVTKSVKGWERVIEIFGDYDLVGSFDMVDAEKYNLIYFEDPYYPIPVQQDESINTDLFFIGADKGRASELFEIAKLANENGVVCDFKIHGLSNENISKVAEGIDPISKTIPYETMLKSVCGTKCLLEVLADGQQSSSLRYYEAVTYNKKLITNNPNITHMSFYNPQYIQYFKNPADINYEWILDGEMVDFNYNNQFSLIHLLEKFSEA